MAVMDNSPSLRRELSRSRACSTGSGFFIYGMHCGRPSIPIWRKAVRAWGRYSRLCGNERATTGEYRNGNENAQHGLRYCGSRRFACAHGLEQNSPEVTVVVFVDDFHHRRGVAKYPCSTPEPSK